MASASLSLHPSLICTCSCARNTLVATSFSSFYSPSLSSVAFSFKRTRWSSRHCSIRSMAPDLLGDFGARDPFPAELESKFGEKVLGNESTEHRILIPNLSAISLAQRSCEPVPSSQLPLPKEDAEKLLKKGCEEGLSMSPTQARVNNYCLLTDDNYSDYLQGKTYQKGKYLKVVGWRLVESDEGMKLQCTWRVRNYGCGIELISRIYEALEVSGHYPDLHLEQPNLVRAELWSTTIGGLSLNDFIVAAKIDLVKTLDLIPKKRIWA